MQPLDLCALLSDYAISLQTDVVHLVSVEVNISIYCCSADIRIYLLLDNELYRKINAISIGSE